MRACRFRAYQADRAIVPVFVSLVRVTRLKVFAKVGNFLEGTVLVFSRAIALVGMSRKGKEPRAEG